MRKERGHTGKGNGGMSKEKGNAGKGGEEEG